MLYNTNNVTFCYINKHLYILYNTGWLDVSLFIYFFICWISRVGVSLFSYHSIAPCTSKGDVSASAICHLWGFILIDRYIGKPS